MSVDRKKLIIPVTAVLTFFLGFEAGGFQFVLQRVAVEFRLNSTKMGLLVAAQYVAIMIMPLLFGRISDKAGKKRILSVFIPAFILGCLLAAVSSGAATFMIGVFIIGAGYSVCECTASASLTDSFPDQSERYLNLTQCTFSIGAVISPLVSQWLINHSGMSWRIVFVLAGCGYLLIYPVFLLSSFTSAQTDANDATKRDFKKKILKSVIFPLLFIAMIIYCGLENGVTFFADTLFLQKMDAGAYGAYAIAAFWLAMSVSRLTFYVIRVNPAKTVAVAFFASFVLITALAVCKNSLPSIVIIALVGMAFGPIWPMIVGICTRAYPGMTGTVVSLLMVGGGFGGTVMPAFMGTFADITGIRAVFMMIALLASAGGMSIVAVIKRQNYAI